MGRGRFDARAAAGLVWGVVSGVALSDDDRALLGAGLGGVVLFGRNVESPAQLHALTAEIRAAASGRVIVAVDQEGGHVVRIGEPLTPLPSPMAIGATRDAALARSVARATAAELAACGIDVVLGPDLDVAVEPRAPVVGARSYGSDPRRVARLGAAAVRGYLEGGVLPVAKHFPGHGRTAVDSHLALPVVEGSGAALTTVDLVPFEAAVAAGVPALMTAHVVHAELDPARPASLSAATARLARDRLGFGGLIVTDAIVMDAVARRQPIEDAAREAITSGADVVMALERAPAVAERLAREAAGGGIGRDRLREAATRAARFAAAAGAVRASAGRRAIGALPHRRAAEAVARRSLTLVSGGGALPIATGESLLVVDVASLRPSPIEDRPAFSTALGSILARSLGASHLALDPRRPRRVASARRRATGAERVVLLTRDAFAAEASTSVVRALAGDRTVHIALRNPVDLELAPSGVAVAAYHEGPFAAAALARALTIGPAAFPGRLPVRLAAFRADGPGRELAS